MDSGLVLSSHNASSLTTGANLLKTKHLTNNIYCASFRTSKVSQQKREIQIENNVRRFQQSSLNHRYNYFQGKFAFEEERNKKFIVQAIPAPSLDSEPFADFVKNFLDIVFKFCYPYATIGIISSAISSSFLAVEKLSDISLPFIISVFQAVVTVFFVALYVSAVNQVYDFQIDKINKPNQPLASGQLSLTTVVVIGISFLTTAVGISWMIGSWPLIWNNVLTALIFSIYSVDLPLLRWKKHPILAAICNVSGGGIVMPITLFLHTQNFVLKRPIIVSRSLIAAVLFMSIHQMSVSLAKDIPDVEGDKTYGVDTFAIRFGQKRVFWISIFLMELAFGVAFFAGITSPYLWTKIVTGVGSVVLASILWYQGKSIDLSNKSSVRTFYLLIWKLLYPANFLLALIR